MNRMCLYCVVVLCLGLSTVGADFIPACKFTSPVRYSSQTVMEGDNATFYCCNTTKLQDLRNIFWMKNITSGMSNMHEHSEKVEVSDISRREAGTYYCYGVRNSTGENVTFAVTYFDVWYPATVESMSIGPPVIFANQTFEVNCSVRGDGTPTWSIFNNVTREEIVAGSYGGISRLLKNGAVYRIHNQSYQGADVSISNISVKCGDTGFWLCSGYNTLNRGHNSTRMFHLTVLCPPQPNPFFPSDHVYTYKAHVGDTLTMSLNVNADPAPIYWWSRGYGSPLKEPFHVNDTPTGTRLTFSAVSVGDLGKYKLQIYNTYGSFWAHFDLQAHGAPEKPYDVQLSNVAANSVDMSWVSGFDMGSHQQFYIVKWVKNQFIQISDIINGSYKDGGEGKVWKYTLRYLDADAHYKMAVVAQNADNTIFSDTIEFNTTSLPVDEGGTTVPIRAMIGGSVGLVVVIVSVVIVARVVMKKRNSANLVGKRPLLQNVQSKYGGTHQDDIKGQPFSGDGNHTNHI